MRIEIFLDDVAVRIAVDAEKLEDDLFHSIVSDIQKKLRAVPSTAPVFEGIIVDADSPIGRYVVDKNYMVVRSSYSAFSPD